MLLPPKSVVLKTPPDDKVTFAVAKLLPTSENVTALSDVATTVANVPDVSPAKVPKEPAEVVHVGASETVRILVEEITALPSGFSILILYVASTDKVIVTVNDVELLNVTVLAVYHIPVEGFKNST